MGGHTPGHDAPFRPPVNLGPTVNSPLIDRGPCISTDGLSLFFSSTRSGGIGADDLWVAGRATVSESFGPPVHLGSTVNSGFVDGWPTVSSDGLSLFFASDRRGGFGNFDLWMAGRASVSEPFGAAINLGPTVNSAFGDSTPAISTDGRILFFASNRPGGFGDSDIWMVTRPSIEDPFGDPINLGPSVNNAARDHSPDPSADGSTLWFTSNRSGGVGGPDTWRVSITAGPGDFDEDGDIDLSDYLFLIQCLGGPGVTPDPNGCCKPLSRRGACVSPADLDGDGDVDLSDAIMLMSAFTGPR